MIRVIKVYSTVGVSGTIETNVTTLGELKPLLAERSINYNDMVLLVGETRNELNVDDALLPEGNFKLYLMPKKTKSGNASDDFSELADEFDSIASSCESIANIFRNLSENSSNPSFAPGRKERDIIVTSREDAEAMRDFEELQKRGY